MVKKIVRKFICRNWQGIAKEVKIIDGDRIITLHLFTETKSDFLKCRGISVEKVSKRFRYKDCKGKVFSSWTTTFADLGWKTHAEFFKQLRHRGFKEVKQ